uniref:SFRICE_021985 n=1 Tax=Spodoptera frugiperda TaxID=7108 RepID=A0A2H1V017_SPOFR
MAIFSRAGRYMAKVMGFGRSIFKQTVRCSGLQTVMGNQPGHTNMRHQESSKRRAIALHYAQKESSLNNFWKRPRRDTT